MLLGEEFFRSGETEKARTQLELAIRENPQLAPAREQLASLLLTSGENDAVFEVLDPLVRNVKEASERFEVVSLLGRAHFNRKEFPQAIELLEKAITLRRPDPDLLNVLAIAHHQVGQDARAAELLERSLALNPEQAPVKELLSQLKAGTTGQR
jgi:Flp pilus assembly protein TadD